MLEEKDIEFQKFLNDINDDNFSVEKYFVKDDYLFEYTTKEINNALVQLQKQMIEYLKNNYPGRFLVFSDWCIHVVTKERAITEKLSENFINKWIV